MRLPNCANFLSLVLSLQLIHLVIFTRCPRPFLVIPAFMIDSRLYARY